jgi:hypothetical protein
VHPKVVLERLGHSQISVTLDTYSHVLPTMQVEAAGKFDSLLGPSGQCTERRKNQEPRNRAV